MAPTAPWGAPAETEAAVTASVAVSARRAGTGSTVRSQVRPAWGRGGFLSPTLGWALAPSLPSGSLGGPLATVLTSWLSSPPCLQK